MRQPTSIDCICPKKSCPRHGDCAACQAHCAQNPRALPYCQRTHARGRLRFTLLTLVTALLFVGVMLACAASPITQTGRHVNQAGSPELWISAGCVLALYLIPLAGCLAGVRAMRVLLAAVVGAMALGAIAVGGVSALLLSGRPDSLALIGVLALCCLSVAASVAWYPLGLRRLRT